MPTETAAPRYSFTAHPPKWSGNTTAIASLAVQHLMGGELNTEMAERSMRLFRVEDATADQLIAHAKKYADGEVGKAAAKYLAGKDPTHAITVIAQQAELDAIAAAKVGIQNGLKMGPNAMKAQLVVIAAAKKDMGNGLKMGEMVRAVQDISSNLFRHIKAGANNPIILGLSKRPVTIGMAAMAILAVLLLSRIPTVLFWWIFAVAGAVAAVWLFHHAGRQAKNSEPAVEQAASKRAPSSIKAAPVDNILKGKTILVHDDPACTSRGPNVPLYPLTSTAPTTVPQSKKEMAQPKLLSSPPAVDISQIDTLIKWRYNSEEIELLVKTPWMHLPLDLKRKTTRLGHDPFSSILSAQTPVFYPAMYPPGSLLPETQSLAINIPRNDVPIKKTGLFGIPFSQTIPDPPYLLVEKSDILNALTLIQNVGQPRRTDQVLISFDGDRLHFDLCGMSTTIPASGIFDIQVRAKPAFLNPLIQVPLEDDLWVINVECNRLFFGHSFSCPCDVQDPMQSPIRLTLDTDDDTLLAVKLKYSENDIEYSGLKHSVAKADEACMKSVNNATHQLLHYGVRDEDVRELVDQRIRTSEVMKII